MKRIIPKSSKVKMEIVRWFSVKDLVLLTFFVALIAAVLLSNILNSWLYIIIILTLAVTTVPQINGGKKIYEEMYAAMKFLLSRKKYLYLCKHNAKKGEEKVDETVNLENAEALETVTADEEDENVTAESEDEEENVAAESADEEALEETMEETVTANEEKVNVLDNLETAEALETVTADETIKENK